MAISVSGAPTEVVSGCTLAKTNGCYTQAAAHGVVIPTDGLRSDPSNLIRVMPAEEARGRRLDLAAYAIGSSAPLSLPR